jgi:hypothetical protein
MLLITFIVRWLPPIYYMKLVKGAISLGLRQAVGARIAEITRAETTRETARGIPLVPGPPRPKPAEREPPGALLRCKRMSYFLGYLRISSLSVFVFLRTSVERSPFLSASFSIVRWTIFCFPFISNCSYDVDVGFRPLADTSLERL